MSVPKLQLNESIYFLRTSELQNPYIQITGFNELVGSGMHSFLIDADDYVALDSEVIFEIIDSEGEAIKIAPIRDLVRGTSRVVSFPIDERVANGAATLYVAVVLNDYLDDVGNRQPVPDSFKDFHNLLITKKFQIDKSIPNTDEIIFKKPPKVSITTSKQPVNKVVKSNIITQEISGSISKKQFDVSRTNLTLFLTDLSAPLIRDMDNSNVTITNPSEIQFAGAKIKTTGKSNVSKIVVPNPDIGKFSANEFKRYFGDEISFKVSYVTFPEFQGTELKNTSFATVSIKDMSTVSGDVEKIKIFTKSDALQTDYSLVDEYDIEDRNLLSIKGIGDTGVFDKEIKLDQWTLSKEPPVDLYYEFIVNGETIQNTVSSSFNFVPTASFTSSLDSGQGAPLDYPKYARYQLCPSSSGLPIVATQINQGTFPNVIYVKDACYSFDQTLEKTEYDFSLIKINISGLNGFDNCDECLNAPAIELTPEQCLAFANQANESSFVYFSNTAETAGFTEDEVCNTKTSLNYIYTPSSSLDLLQPGDKFYTNFKLTEQFDGGNLYYGLANTNNTDPTHHFLIDSTGSIIASASCDQEEIVQLGVSSLDPNIIQVNLREDALDAEILATDTTFIYPVISASNNVTVVQSNHIHTLVHDNNIVIYSGSGNTIELYNGKVPLTSVTQSPLTGQYTVTFSTSSIQSSGSSIIDNSVIFDDAFLFDTSSATATIEYELNIPDLASGQFLNVSQSFVTSSFNMIQDSGSLLYSGSFGRSVELSTSVPIAIYSSSVGETSRINTLVENNEIAVSAFPKNAKGTIDVPLYLDSSSFFGGAVLDATQELTELIKTGDKQLQIPKIKLESKKRFFVGKDVDYRVKLKLAAEQITEPDTRFDVYINSTSLIDRSNRLGKYIGTVATNNDFELKECGEIIFSLTEDVNDASLVFVATGGKWTISDIRVFSQADAGFSADQFETTIPIKVQKNNQDVDFKIEFLDGNGNRASTVLFVDNILFERENVVIEGFDNFISGSLFVGKESSNGVALGLDDLGGSFIKSVPYSGFTDITEATGSPGFLIYSGAITSATQDEYTSSLGVEIVKDNLNYLRFRTEPSVFEVAASDFFLGDPNAQFIDGNNGLIEISSSNFHLDPNVPSLTIKGALRLNDRGERLPDYINRGEWQPGIIYRVDDLVSYEEDDIIQTYRCIQDHCSALQEDEDPNIGLFGPPEPDNLDNWELFIASPFSADFAKTVRLTTDTFFIVYDQAGLNPSPSGSGSLTATTKNFTLPGFRFSSSLDTFQNEELFTTSSFESKSFTTRSFDIPEQFFTGAISFEVEVAKSGSQEEFERDFLQVIAIKPGADRDPQYAIVPQNGTQIRNHSGQLELRIQKSDPNLTTDTDGDGVINLEEVTSGSVKIRFGKSDLILSSSQEGISDGPIASASYNPVIGSNAIGIKNNATYTTEQLEALEAAGSQSLTVFELFDETNPTKVLDTITLVDLTDGLIGGSFRSPRGLNMIRQPGFNSNDNPGKTFIPTELVVTASFRDTDQTGTGDDVFGTEYTSSYIIKPFFDGFVDFMAVTESVSNPQITVTANDKDGRIVSFGDLTDVPTSGQDFGSYTPTTNLQLEATFTSPFDDGRQVSARETFYIVSDGQDGLDAIVPLLENPVHAAPSSFNGANTDLAGSGTVLRVFQGDDELVFDPSLTETGSYKIETAVSSSTNPDSSTPITVGSITAEPGGNGAIIGDHSNIDDGINVAFVDYIISGSRLNIGRPFQRTTRQTITKSKSGNEVKVVNLVSDSFIIQYDKNGENPSPSEFKLIASSSNFDNAQFKFTGDNVVNTNFLDGDTDNTKEITVQAPTSFFADPKSYTVSLRETAETEIEAKDSLSIAAIKPGADSDPQFFLAPLDGTQIKNSTGTLEIQARVSDPAANTILQDLTSGDVVIFDEDTGSQITVGSGISDGGNGVLYNPILNKDALTGLKRLTLRDTSNSNKILDSIALFDVTDGIAGGSFLTNSGLKTKRNPDNTFTPSILGATASFFDTSGTEYRASVSITPSFTDSIDRMQVSTVSGDTAQISITATDNDGGTITLGGASVPTTDVLLTATFTDPATSQTITINETFYIISDGQDGLDAITVILNNEASTIPFEFIDGDRIEDLTRTQTNIRVFEGVNELEYTESLNQSPGFFSVSVTYDPDNLVSIPASISAESNGLGADVSDIGDLDDNITMSSLSAIYTITGVRPSIGDSFTVDKTQTFGAVESKEGEAGGLGPGIVYRGRFDPSFVYYYNDDRRDVVSIEISGDEVYFLANNEAKHNTSPWIRPVPGGNADWATFEQNFSSVATDILLAQDAAITRGLVIGEDSPTGNAGFIRSAAANSLNVSDGDGFYLSASGEFRFAANSGNDFIKLQGNSFDIQSSNFNLFGNQFTIQDGNGIDLVPGGGKSDVNEDNSLTFNALMRPSEFSGFDYTTGLVGGYHPANPGSPGADNSVLYIAAGYQYNTEQVDGTTYNADTAYGDVLIDCSTTTIDGDLTVTGTINGNGGGGTSGVTSLNSLDGELTLSQGTGISISSNSSDTITIASTITNTDTNNYVDNVSFNTSDGILTLRREGLGDLTVDLDGRYPTTDTNTITLVGVSGQETSGTVTLQAGPGANVTQVGNTITISASTSGNTTYNLSAEEIVGSAAAIQLNGSDASTDSIVLQSGTGISISRIDQNKITIDSTVTNTDTNNYVNSISFNTSDGILTLGREGLGNLTVDLDGRYLSSIPTIDQVTDQGSTTTNSITAGNFIINSDKRIKSNIIELTDGIDNIKKLHPYSFIKNDKKQIGILAQELEVISPESVIDGTDGYKTVDIHALSTLNLSAIHSLIEKVEYLENKLKMLEDNGNR